MDAALLSRVCCGNTEAADWLARQWSPYVHGIDDIIDGDITDSDGVLAVFARAAMAYSHPFYLQHILELRSLVLAITNLYADAALWEESTVKWERDWADHNRHVGMEMVVAVATICGGYDHGRAISREQRRICFAEHHDQHGLPC